MTVWVLLVMINGSVWATGSMSHEVCLAVSLTVAESMCVPRDAVVRRPRIYNV